MSGGLKYPSRTSECIEPIIMSSFVVSFGSSEGGEEGGACCLVDPFFHGLKILVHLNREVKLKQGTAKSGVWRG